MEHIENIKNSNFFPNPPLEKEEIGLIWVHVGSFHWYMEVCFFWYMEFVFWIVLPRHFWPRSMGVYVLNFTLLFPMCSHQVFNGFPITPHLVPYDLINHCLLGMYIGGWEMGLWHLEWLFVLKGSKDLELFFVMCQSKRCIANKNCELERQPPTSQYGTHYLLNKGVGKDEGGRALLN